MGEESATRSSASGTPPWQPDQEDGGSFGDWLRKHREGVDIQLEQVAEHTKISRNILQAIEEDRTEDLPARVFVRGFLRQYARFVGLDPEEVVSLYSGAYPSSDEFPASGVQPRGSGNRWIAVALVVLLGAVAAGWWYFGRATPTTSASETALGSVSSSAQGPVRPDASLSANEEHVTAGETADQAPESAPETTSSVVTVTEDDGILVTIDFVEDCWVESTVDGERQISTLYAKGESLRLEAMESVNVLLGNYPGAVVHVNGRAYAWPADIEGNRTELTVDAAFLAAFDDAGEAGPPADVDEVDGEAPNS